MAFLATNLVQNILNELGQVDKLDIFTATDGSATTFVNSAFNNFDNPPEQDVYKNYLAIVTMDAGGASASPEGKWGLVSAYNDATWTGTIATVTDAIAAGDTVMLARQDKFPLQQILFAINRGLQDLGDLPNNADTSLTTVNGQTEYSVPVAAKRGLKQVWVDYGNNLPPVRITDTRNELTAGGTASILYLPSFVAGYTISLVYDGAHPVVSAYNSVINEYVHPRVATCASIIKLLEWYNHLDANQDSDSYFLWLEGQYRGYLQEALTQNPIQKPEKSARFYNSGHGIGNRSRFGGQLLEG